MWLCLFDGATVWIRTEGPPRGRAGLWASTAAHLAAVDAPVDTPVVGLPPGGSFAATFLQNGLALDRDAVERETVEAGRVLLREHPAVDAIVLECTNLPPYKQALQRALSVPVFDVIDLLRDFRKSLG